jgi:hypothetical protein
MLNDFEQKKRNRPIKITDIAITKIPRIKFHGFTPDDNRFIQDQHKLLLTMAKEENDSNEVGMLVDIINWNTWIIMGNGNEVETRDNPEAYKALKSYRKNQLLFMHNHPSTGTFSGTDFKTFCNNNSLFIITVVGNDGNVRTLTKENNFNPENALLYYNHLATVKYKNYKNNGTLAMRELLKNCNDIGLSYKIGGKKK